MFEFLKRYAIDFYDWDNHYCYSRYFLTWNGVLRYRQKHYDECYKYHFCTYGPN